MKAVTSYHLLVAVWLSALIGLSGTPGIAQQPAKIPRIGYLGGTSPGARSERFRQLLHELGYVEGKNSVIEWRHHEGQIDRLPALAEQLVRLKVDIIVTVGPPAARAAKGATTTVPIVMMQVGDPVGSGFVASLARPGGNITGLASLAPELGGKRLELLKEIIPRLTRVAVFGTSTNPDNAQSLREVELAAGAMKVELQYLDVLDIRDPKDIETAFRAASKDRAEAVLMMAAGAVVGAHQTRILELAIKNRLPVIYSGQPIVEAGGLASYGVNATDLDRRAALYVDKILKGAKPAELPVERPTKFDLVINLKAAKQIGVTIPQRVLARADKVIK